MTFILIWVLSFILGGVLRGGAGLAWGFFLGPIGVLLALVIHDNKVEGKSTLSKKDITELEMMRMSQNKRCPYCDEMIRKKAVVCKHCNRDLDSAEPENEVVGKCPVCKKQVNKTDERCPHCDYNLTYFEI
jgi:uncharacterized CHY-type Zn-finger protein